MAQYIIALEALNISLYSLEDDHEAVLNLISGLSEMIDEFSLTVERDLISEKVYKQICGSHAKALIGVGKYEDADKVVDSLIQKSIQECKAKQNDRLGECEEIINLLRQKVECVKEISGRNMQDEDPITVRKDQNIGQESKREY